MKKYFKAFAVLFAFGVGFLVWTVAYAAILSINFQDGAVLSKVGDNPFIAAQQFYHYWDNKTIQSVGFYALFPALFVIFGICYATLRERDPVFGDAKFATRQDVRRAGLFKKKGVVLGKIGGSVMRVNDDRHHLIIGPTRSGKGTNYVMPNMLEWQGSILVTDLKGELWESTSAYRKSQGSQVFFFSPGQPESHRYNPMDFIRQDRGSRTTDIQNMAQILIPEENNSNSAIWAATSRQILAGLISYVSESEEYHGRRNFGEINSLLATGTDLQEVLATIIKAEPILSNFTKQSFNGYIALPDRTAQSALLDLQRSTAIFRNEQILASTLVTDIDIRNMQRKPMSIYLAPNVADITLLMPLMRLFVQQTLDQLLIEFAPDAIPVMFMLDEFRQLGKMHEIVTKLPYVAGYKIKMCFIIQDLKSLDEIYGESTRQSMLGNCGYQLVLGANDQATADYVSKALGKTTVRYNTTSIRRQIAGIHQRTRQENIKERDLLMPQEIRGMDQESLVMLIEGQRPVFGRKIRAYKESPWVKSIKRSASMKTMPDFVEIVNFRDAPVMTHAYSKKYKTDPHSGGTTFGNAPTQDTQANDLEAKNKASMLQKSRENLQKKKIAAINNIQAVTASTEVDFDEETVFFDRMLGIKTEA